jgi:uncharacterized protein involved in exopolysaccharide biosynthesis
MKTPSAKKLGFAVLLLGLALCGLGLWLLLSPAQYKSAARIRTRMMEIESRDSTDSSSMMNANYHDFIQTELEAIQSQGVLGKVVDALHLDVEWGKKYGNGSPLKTATAIRLLQQQMSLEHIRNTRLIEIRFSSDDPNEAARIATAIAEAYQDYCYERYCQRKREGIRMLAEHYQKEEQEIKTRQESLEELGAQLKLPSPKPREDILKSDYPSYFQAKRDLQYREDYHKLLAARIEFEKIDHYCPV